MKPLSNLLINPRVALAALASAVTVVAVSALTAGPALARAASAAVVPRHGLPVPPHGAGSGHISPVSLVVVAALVVGSVAFGLIGWQYDRRRVARSRSAGPDVAAATATQPADEPGESGAAAVQTTADPHGDRRSRASRGR